MRMRVPAAPRLLLLLALGLGPLQLSAQGPPPDWSAYRLGEFISSRGVTPGEILDLDNNGDVLLACRDGCTRATLEAAGIPVIDSQLELLRGWSLLSEDDGRWRSAIPIFDRARGRALSEHTAELAATIAGAIQPDVAQLVAALDAEGAAEHGYAILFSYVLDGGVWAYFDELSLISRRDVARRGAPWAGEAWAYASTRALEPRTSSLMRDTMSVKVTWIEALRPRMSSLLHGPLGLRTLFVEYLERGQPASAELRAKLAEYGVVGTEGELTVPVIDQRHDAELFRLCDRVGTRVAERVIAELDRAALVADLGLESESQALVIAYHEIMWRLMELLVEAGSIVPPAAFTDPGGAADTELGSLVVMVRSGTAAAQVKSQDVDE